MTDFEREYGMTLQHDDSDSDDIKFDQPSDDPHRAIEQYRKSYYERNRERIIQKNAKSRMYKYHTDPEYRRKCIETAKARHIKKVDPVKLAIKKQIADLYNHLIVLKDKYNADILETNDKIAKLKMSVKKIPYDIYQSEQESMEQVASDAVQEIQANTQ